MLGTLLYFPSHSQELSKNIEQYINGNIDEKIMNIMIFHDKVTVIDEDTIMFFIQDLQDRGIEKDREDAIAMSNYVFGHYLNDNSLYSEAQEKLVTSMGYYDFTQNDSMLCVVYNALGNNYYLQSERNKAEEYYLKSISYGKKCSKPGFESLALSNLARIYISQDKYEEAKKLLDEYIALNKANSDIRNLGTAHGVYGQYYLNQEQFDKAINELERSMEYNLSTGNNELIGNGYTNLAIAAYFKEDYDRAKDYFELALAYRKKKGKEYYIAESYFNLGDFFFGINNLDSAKVAYKKSLKISRESENLVGEKDALMQLSILYDSLGMPSEEAEMLRDYIDVDNKLDKEKISRELATLRLSFDQNLKQQKYVNKQREEELRRQISEVDTVWDYWIWIVLVCVLTISGFVFISYRKSINKK
jgi:tetratricopeptide (TPR) repeat protein